MNSYKAELYVQQVIDNMAVDGKMKERIRKDLFQHIDEASIEKDMETILENMGDPKEVAKDFMDTLYQDKDEVIERLIQECKMTNKLLNNYYEYKSKKLIFGLPLVHIKFSRTKRLNKPCLAKGIIAIGDIAVGVISIGGIAFGVTSFGGIGLGAFAFGGLAVGGIALGGIALGLLALGGIAIGLGAMGGLAIGNIAVGGYARGTVAIGGKAIGDYVISGGSEGPNYSLSQVSATKDEVISLIRSAYPNISDWILKMFTIPFK
ncbi:transcriptional regulator [Alkalicella caledoniensis]|uniref:Transcriptional regulator n=1 Tax=Alkalicella caledoniensis TaxID=2731377 RepID=A0A7G9W682_ALKCA|nr:hypothetical protein [Alkalicella caledoniensis]QNO14194.1 transcriptional regulator [Alkalicella caledoniensis]